MKCPCEDCLCVPICRYKSYNILVNKCNLLNNYLIEPYQVSKRPDIRLQKVEEILKPTMWGIDIINKTKRLYIISQHLKARRD